MNIGFLIDGIGNSDLSYNILKLINTELINSTEHSPIIFVRNLYPPVISPLCLMTNLASVNNFQGIAIATDLQAADTLNQSNSPCQKWLYLWDIEWLNEMVNYDVAVEILNNFNIICRSESHQIIIKNFCGKEAHIIDNLNWSELKECLNL